jgi:peptidoglycan/LPS O-acetylase OafA/YrhL
VAARRADERGSGRLRVLDGLRLVAALAVVAFHYTGRDSPAWGESVRTVFPSLSRLTVYGGFGPYLFFMISGFVVLMSAWGRSVPSFIASRVARLYPAYWFAVLVTAALLVTHRQLIPVWDQLGLPGAALNLTMFQSAFGVGHVDGVYWTLWSEMKFYLLLLALACVGITRGRVLAVCFAWPVLGAMAGQAQTPLLAELLQPVQAPFFCIGLVLYLVHREGWSASTIALLGLNYLFALWSCASYYQPWSIAIAGAGVSFRALAVLLTLSIGAVVLATLTPVARVDWRLLTVAGALTYPLYLVHEFPGWILIHALAGRLPAAVTVVAVVTAMLLVAHLVHRFVERPLGPVLRRRLEADLTHVLAGTTDPARRAGGTPRRVAVEVPYPRHQHAFVPASPVGEVGHTAEMPAVRPGPAAGARHVR